MVDWNENVHLALQNRFEEYLNKAQKMFTNHGLANLGGYRWQRALLSIGDYLLPSGRQNISFLVNSATEQASWKRLLRGTGPRVPEARKLMQQLWDRLTDAKPLPEQLDDIISSATNLEPWREAFVRTPKAIDYCGYQAIRFNTESEVYLLKKSQMNGAHAELFSFCLYQNVLRPLSETGKLTPLGPSDYQSVNGTDVEPHILLTLADHELHVNIKVQFKQGAFLITVENSSFQKRPDIAAIFISSLAFVQDADCVSRTVGPSNIESVLLAVAGALSNVTQGKSGNT